MAGFMGLFGDKPETVELALQQLGAAEERYKALDAERGRLLAENARLERNLKSVQTKLGKEKAKAAALESAKPAKPRKIGPVEGEPLPSNELLELIEAAELVEIAFSDGQRELASLLPRTITGAAWRETVVGLQLDVGDFVIEGTGERRALAGYGLLLDGELAAYAERLDPLLLMPGARYSLTGDIVFGKPRG